MSAVVLLGPQRFSRTLSEAAARAGLGGRFASVTAGWQEREAEDLELHEHLGERTVNLRLYERAEEVFRRDPSLADAHRARQERLREIQAVYRIRLGHAQAALRELAVRDGDPALLAAEKEAALQAIREIDARHLERVAAVHREFETTARPRARPAVARQVDALGRELGRAGALLIAGGHVPVLLNRLRLFGFPALAGERPVCAWSGGAMALTERVVLFHHSPPQGFGNTEVLEPGLALARGVVLFPHARRRLRLDDARRMELLARRFAPAECLTLEDGAWLIDRGGSRVPGPGVARLGTDGRVAPLAAAA